MTLKTTYPKRNVDYTQSGNTLDIGSGQEKNVQELDLFSYQNVLPNPSLKSQPKTEVSDSDNPTLAQFVRDYLHLIASATYQKFIPIISIRCAGRS